MNEDLMPSIDFPFIRIRQAPPRNGWRGRPARERGLNENNFMVLVLGSGRKWADRTGFAQEDMTG